MRRIAITIVAVLSGMALPLALVAAQPPAGAQPETAEKTGGAKGKAQATKPEKDKEPTRAEKVIDEAIAKLRGLESASANLVIKADILGQRFQLSGEYARAPQDRIKLVLTLSGLADARGRMLQISDGTTLWDFKEILDGQSYDKVDISKVFAKLDDPGFDQETRQSFRTQLGFAGPDALLESLRKSISFDALEDQETFDGHAVWIARGTWKDRQALNLEGQAPLPAFGPLPAYVPSVAAVWIDKETGWPYQLKMDGQVPSVLARPDAANKKGAADPKAKAKALASQEFQPSHLLMTYSDVKLNAPWKPEDFAFEPPRSAAEQNQVRDSTQQYLAGMDAYLANEAAKKKAEGATKGTAAPEAAPKAPAAPDTPAPDAEKKPAP